MAEYFIRRRQRRMEEARAAAGGVTVQTNVGVAGSPASPSAPAADPVASLRQLKELHDAGIITAAEFEAKKAEILKRMCDVELLFDNSRATSWTRRQQQQRPRISRCGRRLCIA